VGYSFVLNPDGHDIFALIETASYHQYEALKDVMDKYFAFRPSMGISLSVRHLRQSNGQLAHHCLDKRATFLSTQLSLALLCHAMG
jgi:hypothetical protein